MDADASVYATVTEEDVRCGVPGDPCECVIAKAFRRATGSPDVLIGVQAAYVVMKKGDEYIALRFAVPTATRRAIITFDASGVFPEGALELRKQPPANRLVSQRARDKRLRERYTTMGHKPQRGGPRKTGRNASPLARTLVVKRHAT